MFTSTLHAGTHKFEPGWFQSSCAAKYRHVYSFPAMRTKKLPGNFNFLFYLKIVFFLLILILGLYILILRFQAPTLPRSSLFPHSPKSILLLVLYCYKTDRHLKMGKKGKKIFVCFVLFRNSIHIKQEKQ